MKTHQSRRHSFEFCFPKLDALLLVEETDGEVVIRASRNKFSDERKARFVRYLASEGFIPESYRFHPLAESGSFMGVRWMVDISWLKPDPALAANAQRSIIRVLAGGGLVWLLTMGCALRWH
jgi:hypothetical protein